jgi:hypothetical protein
VADEVGIPLVLRNSVTQTFCEKCGLVLSRTIQYVDRLVAAAALGLAANRVKLRGFEIRFLRKALEQPAKELASRFGVSAETFSRWA